MNSRAIGYLCFALLVVVGVARPAEPVLTLPNVESKIEQVAKDKPKPPDDKKKLTEPPKTDIFAQAPVMGSQFPTGFNPQMMGDFSGYLVRRTITVFGVQTTTNVRVDTTPMSPGQPPVVTATKSAKPVSRTFSVLVPVASAGAFKIAENASPRPVDRVFFTYNYFSDIRDPQRGAASPVNATQSNTVALPGGATTLTTSVETILPGLPRASANLHREVFGFEKTFLNGNASVELRVPLFQQASNLDGFSAQSIGDLTIVGKYAFFLDRDTGNVFSAGLAVTAPTGPGFETDTGTLRTTLVQPWVGYIWNADRFFLHAFHSVVVPTDSQLSTLLFNDVGLNYWLYRSEPNRALRFVVPMVEAHVTTPLNHRDPGSNFFVPDQVVLTGGAHLGLFDRGTLSLGVATPVSGPRPFSVEAFAQFNLRF